MTELTNKELKYLIDLCSSQLDKSHIDLDEVRDVIAQNFNNDTIIIDTNEIGWEYAYTEFVQFLIEELKDYELNDLVSSQGNTEVFVGTGFENKTLELSGDLAEFLFSYAMFDNCTIEVDTQKIPSHFMSNANLNNCSIIIQPGCTTIANNAFDCDVVGNNEIILPKTIKSIGSMHVGHQSFYDELTLKYIGTIKEFKSIKKSININCNVICSDGAIEHIAGEKW